VMGNTTGKYTASIVIGSGQGGTTAQALDLIGTMKATGVSSGVAGSSLYLSTVDGGKNWSCTSTSGTILAKYRPGACK
jgi:hypothetical protein